MDKGCFFQERVANITIHLIMQNVRYLPVSNFGFHCSILLHVVMMEGMKYIWAVDLAFSVCKHLESPDTCQEMEYMSDDRLLFCIRYVYSRIWC